MGTAGSAASGTPRRLVSAEELLRGLNDEAAATVTPARCTAARAPDGPGLAP